MYMMVAVKHKHLRLLREQVKQICHLQDGTIQTFLQAKRLTVPVVKWLRTTSDDKVLTTLTNHLHNQTEVPKLTQVEI